MLTQNVIPSESLSDAARAEILALCNAAYKEDVSELFATYGTATHVLARVDGALASHAMWVTRRLKPGDGPALKTAYVEMVATHPAHQRRGHATAALSRLMSEISADYALAALCPAIESV